MNKSGKYYDKLADIYDDATEKEGAWTPPLYIYERLKNTVNNDTRILDIGIGTGKAIDSIYKSNNYSSITGVDVSTKMLEKCKNKYPEINLIEISSIKDLASFQDKYDLIICSGTLEFIENIEAFFQQCNRLLETQGVICFTYEPIIDFHPIQQDKKSLTVGDANSSLHIEGFYTYRYTPIQMYSYLDQYDFRPVNDVEFVSYSKQNEKIIYHLITAECKN